MQHRMSEITIVPTHTNSTTVKDNGGETGGGPACVSSIQTGVGGGYRVKRVLHHHSCYTGYKSKTSRGYDYESRTQHEHAVMLRAVFVTGLALLLVFLLLWYVSEMRAGQGEQLEQ